MTVRTNQPASGPAFDWGFIVVPLALALSLGVMASVSAAMLIAVVMIDVWLFANPHLVATYTRICASAAHVRRHWFLIFCLPMVVLAGVTVTALAYEVAGLFTLYFIAQTYHVARQSFGIARAFRRAESSAFRPDRLAEGLVYLFPAWGLLARCAEAPQTFLGYPIQLPAVPVHVADATGFAALLCALWWLLRHCRAMLAGRQANWRPDGFVASHVCVSFWHNLQYLAFVWVQNIRRDGQTQCGVTAQVAVDGLWKKAARYCGLCLVLGAVIYLAADWAGTRSLWLGLPTVLIAHFTLNFHHYLVDGVVWRRSRPWLMRWFAVNRSSGLQQKRRS
jgi:hypothetical protein